MNIRDMFIICLNKLLTRLYRLIKVFKRLLALEFYIINIIIKKTI